MNYEQFIWKETAFFIPSEQSFDLLYYDVLNRESAMDAATFHAWYI